MAKLKPTAYFQETYPGVMAFRCRYDKALVEVIKSFGVGPTWCNETKTRFLDKPLAKKLKKACEERGYKIQWEERQRHSALTEMDERLRPYQQAAAAKAISDGYRLLAFEMGLGKGFTCITALKGCGTKRNLVVCPASVREVWLDEFTKWWPDGPETTIIYPSKKWEIPEGPCNIVVSYEMLSHLTDVDENDEVYSKHKWDSLVLDEGHYIKNARATRSVLALGLSETSGATLRLLNSGTPMTQQPKDLHAQLNWLRPGSIGTWWNYVNTFCDVEAHQYGHNITGSRNEDFFHKRFGSMIDRVTLADAAQWMPSISTQVLRPDQEKSLTLLEELKGTSAPVLVFTWLKRTAYAVSEKIKDRPVYTITGDMLAKLRAETIKQAKKEDRAVLVATMDCAGIGIDLTHFYLSYVYELSPKLSTIRQAIGRVARLSSTKPVMRKFIVRAGTAEEELAVSLGRKLAELGKVLRHGGAENTLTEVLEPPEFSNEEFMSRLQAELGDFVEGDYDEYL